MRTTRASILVLALLVFLPSTSIAGESDARVRIERILTDPAADVTAEVNALLALGPEQVRPVLETLFAKLREKRSAASGYRTRIESLTAILGGREYEPPDWDLGSHFRVLCGFAIRFRNRPDGGGWSGNLHYGWTPSEGVEKHLGEGWREPLKPEAGRLLELLLEPEPDSGIPEQLDAHTLLDSAAAALGQAARIDAAFAAALLEAHRGPKAEQHTAALLDAALRHLGSWDALDLLIARFEKFIRSPDPHHDKWAWYLPGHLRAAGGEDLLLALRYVFAEERPEALAVFDEVVGGAAVDAAILAGARAEPSIATLSALEVRMERDWLWTWPAPETCLAAMDLGLEILGEGPEEVHAAARSLLEVVVRQSAVIYDGEDVAASARRIRADIDDGLLLPTRKKRRSPFADTVSCDRRDALRDWTAYARETGATAGYRPNVSFALWRDGRRLHLRVSNHGGRVLLMNRLALVYGDRGPVRPQFTYHIDLGQAPLHGRGTVPASAFERIPPNGSYSVSWPLPPDLLNFARVGVSFHDRFSVEGELPGIRLVAFEATVETPLPDGSPLLVRTRDPAGLPVDGKVSVYRFPIGEGWPPQDGVRRAPPDEARELDVASSAADNGEYWFDHLDTGLWRIVAEAPGRALVEARVEIAAGMPVRPLDLVLLPGSSLSGRVLLEGDTPLPHVEVAAARIDANSVPWGPTFDFRARTDDEGVYRLDGLAPGDYALWIRRGGRVWDRTSFVRVPAVDHYDISVTDGAVVRGQVTPKAGGAPIAGARVELLPEHSDVPIDWALTDEEGRYELRSRRERLSSGGLCVTADGYARERFSRGRFWSLRALAELRKGEEYGIEIPLELEVEARIVGTVRGPDGPVAGALVLVWVRTDDWRSRPFQHSPHTHATTGEDGKWSLGGLAAGEVAVEVVAAGLVHPGWEDREEWPRSSGSRREISPDHIKALVGGRERRCDVVMKADPTRGGAVEISGVVRDAAGRPMPLSWVNVTRGEGTLADVGGRFQVVGHRWPGLYSGLSVFGYVRGFDDPWVGVDPDDRNTWSGVEIRFRKLPVLRGRVVSSSSRSVAGARVRIARRCLDSDGSWMVDWVGISTTATRVRTDGSFEIPVPEDGWQLAYVDPAGVDFVVSGEAKGHAPGFSKPFSMVDGPEGVSVKVVLGPGRVLEGVVVTPDGKPIAGAAIHLRAADDDARDAEWPPRHPLWPGSAARTVSDDTGIFRISHLVAGKYTVRAEKAGMAVAEAEVRLPQDGRLRLELRTRHPLGGVILDPEGRPLPGVTVRLECKDGKLLRDPEQTTSDEMGRFRLERVPAGIYRVIATSDLALGPGRSAPFPAGRTDLSIKLPRAHRITGRLLDARGRPLRDVSVIARPVVPNIPWVKTRTNRDGGFELWFLAPISYDVEFDDLDITVRAVPAGTELEYRLRGDLTITGRVVRSVEDESGPLLILVPLDPEPNPRILRRPEVWPKDEGSFTFKYLPPGRYRVALDGSYLTEWRMKREVVVEAGATGVEIPVERIE